MAKGKHEPGAACIIVGDFRHYERNIGAMVTLTELKTCPCGCGYSGWEYEKASRPIMVSLYLSILGVIPVHFVSASAETDRIPEWKVNATSRPFYPAKWLLPIDGEDLDIEETQEAPVEGELVGLPGFAQTWNCRCVALPIVRP